MGYKTKVDLANPIYLCIQNLHIIPPTISRSSQIKSFSHREKMGSKFNKRSCIRSSTYTIHFSMQTFRLVENGRGFRAAIGEF